MLSIALALALFFSTAWAVGYLRRTTSQSLAHGLQSAAGGLMLIAAVVLALRGSLMGAVTLASIGVGLLPRAWWTALLGRAGGAASQTTARTSRVVTDHLEMVLDLDSGAMTGRVIKGFFAGRKLERLRPVE